MNSTIQLPFGISLMKFTAVNVPTLTVTMKCFTMKCFTMKYLFCLGITLSPLGKGLPFHYCVPPTLNNSPEEVITRVSKDVVPSFMPCHTCCLHEGSGLWILLQRMHGATW